MQATRRARIESVIHDEISVLILREVKDPRIPPLSITSVKLTEDGKQATLYFMLTDRTDPAEAQESERSKKTLACIEGLQSASGFLRRHIAKVLELRQAPALLFKQDRGLENANRVQELLRQLENEKK